MGGTGGEGKGSILEEGAPMIGAIFDPFLTQFGFKMASKKWLKNQYEKGRPGPPKWDPREASGGQMGAKMVPKGSQKSPPN